MKRYRLVPPADAGGPADIASKVVDRGDVLRAWTYMALVKASLRGRVGPFTVDEVLAETLRAPGTPEPTYRSVQADLEVLAEMGLLTVSYRS